MELEITWKRTIKVWWALFWRNIIAIIASTIIAWIVGFIFGVILTFSGIGQQVINMIVAPIGALIGIVISVIPLKLILGKNFSKGVKLEFPRFNGHRS